MIAIKWSWNTKGVVIYVTCATEGEQHWGLPKGDSKRGSKASRAARIRATKQRWPASLTWIQAPNNASGLLNNYRPSHTAACSAGTMVGGSESTPWHPTTLSSQATVASTCAPQSRLSCTAAAETPGPTHHASARCMGGACEGVPVWSIYAAAQALLRSGAHAPACAIAATRCTYAEGTIVAVRCT